MSMHREDVFKTIVWVSATVQLLGAIQETCLLILDDSALRLNLLSLWQNTCLQVFFATPATSTAQQCDLQHRLMKQDQTNAHINTNDELFRLLFFFSFPSEQ